MTALWLAAYVVRARFPVLWMPFTRWPNPESPISHVIQALPTTAIGAAFAGWQLGGLDGALRGALWGAGAPVLHHVVKALPVKYRGALNDAATKWLNAQKAGGVGLLLLLTGCSSSLPSPSEITEALDAELTAEQRECVGAVSAGATLRAGVCGKNNEGSCNNDRIFAEALEAKLACLGK